MKGKVDYRHTYIDFSNLEVTISKNGGGSEVVKTCPAAMGFAFAAGTTDGPGAFDFKQGDDKVQHLNISLKEVMIPSETNFLLYLFVLLLMHTVLFLQGNAFWRLVRNVLKTPDKQQVDCQSPKPILLDTGEMKEPYDWAVSCYFLIPLPLLSKLTLQNKYCEWIGYFVSISS